jgi:biopolymer transport protein ExbB
MMYPLALISIVGVVLVLIYLLTIRRNAVVSDRFMNAAEAMIRKRDYLGLVAFCHRQNESMARITQKTLDFLMKNQSASFGEVREIAEAEGSRQAGLLTSRITYLADIGSISPMVGLLGTVLGMIKSFLLISSGDVQGVRQMQLAEGVSEALITTAAGLMIGIPALVFYSLFRGRVQKYIAELEAASTHLMALLHAQVERQAPMSYSAPTHRTRDDYAMPVPSPLGADRPDLHGI